MLNSRLPTGVSFRIGAPTMRREPVGELPGEPVDGGVDVVEERGPIQEVLRRVARDAELGEDGEVRAGLGGAAGVPRGPARRCRRGRRRWG